MKKMRVLFAILIATSLLTGTFSIAFADSIWGRTSTSPYSVSKSFRVGDIITIIVLETTSAVQKAGTDTNASDSLSLAFSSNLSSFYHSGKAITGSGGNVYKGLGSTTRTSNVTAKIAAVVVRVLPNGNLMVSGDHRVEVNDEIQVLKISGMVRPKDVSLQNTVYSYQVAGADVSVKGKGVVGEAESPGAITRFLNWIF
ncbi:MAG: flagellar basal body L-ring protein FlgH [bacterium]